LRATITFNRAHFEAWMRVIQEQLACDPEHMFPLPAEVEPAMPGGIPLLADLEILQPPPDDGRRALISYLNRRSPR
jgi:hypothetical protein